MTWGRAGGEEVGSHLAVGHPPRSLPGTGSIDHRDRDLVLSCRQFCQASLHYYSVQDGGVGVGVAFVVELRKNLIQGLGCVGRSLVNYLLYLCAINNLWL